MLTTRRRGDRPGVIAGVNMVLVDFHPGPTNALMDGPQAILLEELPYFLDEVTIAC